jgi:hypothetical protein
VCPSTSPGSTILRMERLGIPGAEGELHLPLAQHVLSLAVVRVFLILLIDSNSPRPQLYQESYRNFNALTATQLAFCSCAEDFDEPQPQKRASPPSDQMAVRNAKNVFSTDKIPFDPLTRK